MTSHNDVYEIDGEHYRITSVHPNGELDEYDGTAYGLHNLHTPHGQIILSKDELEQHERVEELDPLEYLQHHVEEMNHHADAALAAQQESDTEGVQYHVKKLKARQEKVRDLRREVRDKYTEW